MFEYRIRSRRTSSGSMEIKRCALCGENIIVSEPDDYYDLPHDMYGLPIGHETEWFDELVDYCPSCGLTAWDIKNSSFIPKAKEYDFIKDGFKVDTEKLEKLKRIAEDNIPDTEKKLKSACLLGLISKNELYLYYDFLGEEEKAQKLRDEILKYIDGVVEHANPNLEKDGVTSHQDDALIEIELHRRNGDFSKALELCRKYKKMPDQRGICDAHQWNYEGYRKIIKELERLCKHEDSEAKFGSSFGRKN